VYPQVVQIIFTFVVPLGFISFYPASEFLGVPGAWEIPVDLALVTPVVGLVSGALALLMFRKGMQRYEGSGS